MEKEKEGFPITSLREINTLLKAQHPNIVTVRVSANTSLNDIIPVRICANIFLNDISKIFEISFKKEKFSASFLKEFLIQAYFIYLPSRHMRFIKRVITFMLPSKTGVSN